MNKHHISDYYQKHILFELLVQDHGYEEACHLFDEACKFYIPLETAIKESNNILETR
jgi:hypothetical protein